MKVLALDCTAKSASAAICENGRIIAQSFVNSARKHSETLMPMIEQLFKMADCNIDDIDLFACNAGPGSFTGVRIGVAQIKGLAFGRNKPCIPVSTLEALAYNMKGFSGIICPVMDARRDQYYNALFESDGKNIVRLCSDRVIAYDALQKELDVINKNIYIVGDGYDAARQQLSLSNLKETPALLINQNAWSTAYCAEKMYSEKGGKYSDIELKPIYLRASQAERTRNERMNDHE